MVPISLMNSLDVFAHLPLIKVIELVFCKDRIEAWILRPWESHHTAFFIDKPQRNMTF